MEGLRKFVGFESIVAIALKLETVPNPAGKLAGLLLHYAASTPRLN
jgi:hypothetical protein